MVGFFDASLFASKPPLPTIPYCGACGLLDSCRSPKLDVVGMGERRILIVGEFPDALDDRQNEAFVQGTKRTEILEAAVGRAGLDLFRDCWLTTAMICHPGEENNRSERVDHCRPNLMETIARLDPDVVIPLGSGAIRSVVGKYYKDGVGKVDPWVSWKIPLQAAPFWVCPSRGLRFIIDRQGNREAEAVWNLFARDIEEAVKIEGKPWPNGIPDYEESIECLYDPADAIAWMEKVLNSGKGSLSFDFECNCLKPDNESAQIISVGLSWSGEETVAFYVTPDVAAVLAKLLASKIPKVGAHNKFEDRWSRAKLGVRVGNWVWDTMLSAHHLDNRKDITSVKFQAFVRLGVPPWDDVLRPYFEGDGPMGLNRVDQVDPRTLLKYNSKDALIEYRIAEHQRAEMLEGIKKYGHKS